MKKCNLEEALQVIQDTINERPQGDRYIVVLDRGWIFAGNVEPCDDGTYLITNAYNVRKWETGGYGALSISASGANAKLDKCAPIKFKEAIFMTPISEDWHEK